MGQTMAKGLHQFVGDPPVVTEEDLLVERRGVVWNLDGSLRSCVFCDYASKKKTREIIYADDLVMAFSPMKSAAKQHILVVPHHRHVSNVGNLFSSDAHVLDRMRSVAWDLLKKNGADPGDTQYSFHVPPWNSVDHVHMHALELPFTSWFTRAKFAEGKPWCVAFACLREWIATNTDIPDDEGDGSFPMIAMKEVKLDSGDFETKEELGEEKGKEPTMASHS